jgi:hypothetical protein
MKVRCSDFPHQVQNGSVHFACFSPKLYVSAGGSHFSLARVNFNFCTNVLAIGKFVSVAPRRNILMLIQHLYGLNSG